MDKEQVNIEECAFIIHPIDMEDKKFVKSLEFNEGVHIAFVPKQGFQSCKFYNGSRTWQSIITKDKVVPTHVMLPIFEVDTVKPIEFYKFKGLIDE